MLDILKPLPGASPSDVAVRDEATFRMPGDPDSPASDDEAASAAAAHLRGKSTPILDQISSMPVLEPIRLVSLPKPSNTVSAAGGVDGGAESKSAVRGPQGDIEETRRREMELARASPASSSLSAPQPLRLVQCLPRPLPLAKSYLVRLDVEKDAEAATCIAPWKNPLVEAIFDTYA